MCCLTKQYSYTSTCMNFVCQQHWHLNWIKRKDVLQHGFHPFLARNVTSRTLAQQRVPLRQWKWSPWLYGPVLENFFCGWATRQRLKKGRKGGFTVEVESKSEIFQFLSVAFRKLYKYMGVSKNRGTPKSSILIGFSIINHPFWGTPIFGNTHIQICSVWFLIQLFALIWNAYLGKPSARLRWTWWFATLPWQQELCVCSMYLVFQHDVIQSTIFGSWYLSLPAQPSSKHIKPYAAIASHSKKLRLTNFQLSLTILRL